VPQEPVVPKRYQDMVQILAVLAQYFGGTRIDKVPGQTQAIRALWRARLLGLRALGWGPLVNPTPTRNYFDLMHHCRPAFVLTDSRARCCRYGDLCPFCWARDTRDDWLRVDAAFFPAARTEPTPTTTRPRPAARKTRAVDPGADGPTPADPDLGRATAGAFDLVTRSFRFGASAGLLPDLIAGRVRGAGEIGFIGRREEVNALVKPLASAGLTWGAMEVMKPIEFARMYYLQVRQLFLVPHGSAGTLGEPPGDYRSNLRVKVYPRVSRKVAMQRTARFDAYPTALIDPAVDAGKVRDYLVSRGGARMKAQYGVFRNARTRGTT